MPLNYLFIGLFTCLFTCLFFVCLRVQVLVRLNYVPTVLSTNGQLRTSPPRAPPSSATAPWTWPCLEFEWRAGTGSRQHFFGLIHQKDSPVNQPVVPLSDCARHDGLWDTGLPHGNHWKLVCISYMDVVYFYFFFTFSFAWFWFRLNFSCILFNQIIFLYSFSCNILWERRTRHLDCSLKIKRLSFWNSVTRLYGLRNCKVRNQCTTFHNFLFGLARRKAWWSMRTLDHVASHADVVFYLYFLFCFLLL